jgi:WD40 repeat protein
MKLCARTCTDCCIKLWNVDALLSTPDHAKEALLATLSSHSKSVNVVRWSKDGKLLASGSDDNYILVHKFTPGAISNQAFGGSAGAVKNKETWSR